jgi:hypothetical protein
MSELPAELTLVMTMVSREDPTETTEGPEFKSCYSLAGLVQTDCLYSLSLSLSTKPPEWIE